MYSMMLDYILSKDSIYKFVSFQSGEECIQNLYLNPDVIILDYGLPGMNGYETLLEVKKFNPNIHVIILSSNTDEKVASKMIAAGADDYFLKQGHGETQIIDRIEAILAKDELKKLETEVITGKGLGMKKLFFFIVVLILLSIGFICLKS